MDLFSFYALGLAFLLIPLMLGAVIDKRRKSKAYDSGSSRIQLLLTLEQASAVYEDSTAEAGWIMPSYQESTQIGPDRDSEEVKDEADNLIKVRVNRDEFVIITTFFQTDDDTLALLDFLEEPENAVPIRYPMPTNIAGETQWVFGYAATVRKENWRVEAANNADRKRTVTFVLSKDEVSGLIRHIATLPDEQTDAAWAPYAAFKDTPA